MKNKFSFWCALTALACFATSQALADLELGRYSLSTMSAQSLKTTQALSSVLGSAPRMKFVVTVGGVAFDAVAVPVEALDVRTLALTYDPTREDGQRLVLTVNGKPVEASIYDWELLPIVRYAASTSTSCFTLFGELDDKDAAERIRLTRGRILNYDAAFVDTLLGLRLFQLDVLTLDHFFSVDLPKDNGRYVLGNGEKEPNLLAARDALTRYEETLDKLIAEGRSENFRTDLRSWVITDPRERLTFSIEEGKLTFQQEPFFYFWSDDPDQVKERKDAAFLKAARAEGIVGPTDNSSKLDQLIEDKQSAYEKAKKEKRVELALQQGILKPGQTDEDLSKLRVAADDAYDSALDQAVFDLAKEQGLTSEGETPASFRTRIIRDFLDATGEEKNEVLLRNRKLREDASASIAVARMAHESFKSKMEVLDEAVDAALEEATAEYTAFRVKVEKADEASDEAVDNYTDADQTTGSYLKEYSERHVPATQQLAEMNPAVWDAARKTMRFGAFFRYCQKSHPAAWKKFVAALQLESRLPKLEPKVTTPTVMELK